MISPLLNSHDVEYSDDTCNIHTPIPTTKKIKSLLKKEKKKGKKSTSSERLEITAFLQSIFWPKNKILASFKFGWERLKTPSWNLDYIVKDIEINNKALRLSKVLKKSRRDLNNGEMKDSIQQLLNPSEQIHILLLPSLLFLLCLCVCSVRDCCACVRLVMKSRRESFRNQGERENCTCCVCVILEIKEIDRTVVCVFF